jgi:quercetin dioxygenase-like cupin family protein
MRAEGVVFASMLLMFGLAQTAGTPSAAQQSSGITDVKVETLGRSPSAAAPGYVLLLSRLTFAPGGSIAMHTHPGDAVFYVESGTITWTTGTGSPLLTRAAAGAAIAAGTPTPPETLVAGMDVVLEPGDSVFYDGQTSHEVRNDGAGEAVVLYSGLRAADEPGISFMDATPAP